MRPLLAIDASQSIRASDGKAARAAPGRTWSVSTISMTPTSASASGLDACDSSCCDRSMRRKDASASSTRTELSVSAMPMMARQMNHVDKRAPRSSVGELAPTSQVVASSWRTTYGAMRMNRTKTDSS